jgi:hypothetical protein
MQYIVLVTYRKVIITAYGPFPDEGGANSFVIRDSAIFPERTYQIKPLIPAV